jgi:hypothetical protein
MERELVALLGAGLTSLATGFGVAVPVGAIDRGYTLVDVLSRESGPRVGAALDSMVQSLWLAWQQSGIGRETITLHADALPAILELNRPPREVFAAARQYRDAGRVLAADVIERARQSGDIQRAALDEGAVYTLLEKLFDVILEQQATLMEMMAAVELYLQTDLWRREVVAEPAAPTAPPAVPIPVPPTAPEPIQPTLLGRLSLPAQAAIRVAAETHGRIITDIEVTVGGHGRQLTATIERIAALAVATPEFAPALVAAARAMAAGDFAAADRALVAAQEQFVQRATADLATARQQMHHAADVLAARAELELVRFDFRRCARHFRAASRCFTKADLAPQWHYLNRQAAAWREVDRLQTDDTALGEAIRALAEACALQPSPATAMEWAHTQLQLATIHTDLGMRSNSMPDCFAAAGHADQALAVFARLQAGPEQTTAHLARAKALWFAGDGPGHVQALDASAQSYRDALGGIPRETSPERWIETTSMLGQVLLRMAAVRAEPKLLPAAIEQLRAASQYATTCKVNFDAVTTETALGRALLAEYAAGGQPLLLDLAATAFRRAIKVAGTDKAFARKAALQHELGMTLWAMAERAADANGMLSAEETLDASVATYKGLNDAAGAQSVAADLARLREALPGRAKSPVVVQYS